MTETPESRLRGICLAQPGATEKEAWGSPTFRIRDRMFAMSRTGPDGPKVWLKAAEGAQEFLVTADPARFFAPPYMRPKGWVGVRLGDGVDWNEVAVLARRAWRLAAPRRLAATVPEERMSEA